MMSNIIMDELTDTHSVLLTSDPRSNEYVAEVFIKDEDCIWYSILRYDYLPTLGKLMRDTYILNCKSPRPYMPGQVCDGSITSPVFHLYYQLCIHLWLDPIELYNEAYDDRVFTNDQLKENLAFADWQGVTEIELFDAPTTAKVIESIREVNMHQLANLLEERIGM
jgi:hypothetical protein